jgi:hypothetical protein
MFNLGPLGWLKFRHLLRRNKWPFVMVLMVLLVIGIIAGRGWKEIPSITHRNRVETKINPSSLGKEIAQSMKEGDYVGAVNHLRTELKKDPNDPFLNKLLPQLTEELQMDVKFHYLIERKKYMETRTLSPDVTLTPKDVYYFSINPSHAGYLYFFQIDSAGKISVLYPNKEYSPSSNPLLPGPLRVPDGFRWFFLDETKGVESIYLVAARMENKRLEGLIERIKSEKTGEAAARLNQELIAYLKSIESTPQKVPGVAVKIYQFTHG